MLLSALLLALVVLVAASVLAVLTALPFVLAVDLAERRSFSTARWGALQLALALLGLVVGWVALRHALLLALAVPLLCWAVPLVLLLLGPDDRAVGGYRGVHQG